MIVTGPEEKETRKPTAKMRHVVGKVRRKFCVEWKEQDLEQL